MHVCIPQRFTQANQWVDLSFVAIKQAPPAQIVRQVFGGHTMKRNHPVFEPAIIGVHVLNVESAINPAFLTWVDRSMSNALCLGKVGIDTCAVGSKNRVRVYQGS